MVHTGFSPQPPRNKCIESLKVKGNWRGNAVIFKVDQEGYKDLKSLETDQLRLILQEVEPHYSKMLDMYRMGCDPDEYVQR